MSGRLRLKLLGGFRAGFDDGEACRLPTRKCDALLAFLALPCGRFHSRDRLAALLWAETAEAQARQSLRQALGSVRRALREQAPSALLTHGDTVALNPGAVEVDALDFEAALADGGTEALERAAALYEGDLLAGFRVDESPFEEWRTVERERLHERALEGLAKLLREHLRADRAEPAIRTALRLLALDPLQEAVHRTLMRLLVRRGRRAAALSQYETCVSHLQRELGIEPEQETRQLYREILRTAGPRSPSGAAPKSHDSPSTRAVDIPIIGRDAEVEHLQAALQRMVDEGERVVLVTGEAGIGKTRLIEELVLRATARGAAISLGRCHESEQMLPLRPWIEALRSDGAALDARIRDRLTGTARAQLVPLFPELGLSKEAPGTSPTPALLFDPLLELIGLLASEQPRVIIVEDLHWADAMSARFLAFLGRRVKRWPVLIIGTMRPEELVDAAALAQALKELRVEGRLAEITLGPLTETETRALVQALRPSPRVERDSERLAGDIWTLSEGNPFVVVESIRNLQEQPSRTSKHGFSVSRSVRDLVGARLERLPELSRQCVAVAATIGQEFPFPLLARAARVSDAEAAAAAEELVRRRILESVGDRLDFCHDWIRVVAYEGLLPPKRALLHAAVAGALEDFHRDRLDEVADQLGSHYGKAGDARRAIPHLVRFARLASQRYALDDGYRALSQAMAATDQLPPSERDRCRLDVALHQAFVLSTLGRPREILDLLRRHRDAVERVAEAPLRSEYYFRLGLTHHFLGEHAQAEDAARRALEEAERIGDPEGIGKALHVLSLHAYNRSRPEAGIAHAMRAISLLDLPHTQDWLGLAYLDLALNSVVAGNLDQALDATKRMEAIARSRSIPRLLVFAGYVAAWVLGLRGDATLAVERARRALDIARDAMVASLVSSVLGHAHLEEGDAASAVSELTRALGQLKGSPNKNVEVRNMALLGEAYLSAGDTMRARETAARALELAQADGMPLNIGLAQRAQGRITRIARDLDGAEAYFSQALETFAACGATFEAARTRLDLAAVRGARGHKEVAREHLVAALAVFEAANAPKRAAAARDLARSLGITLPAAAPAPVVAPASPCAPGSEFCNEDATTSGSRGASEGAALSPADQPIDLAASIGSSRP